MDDDKENLEIGDPGKWRAHSWHRKTELVVLIRAQSQLLRDMAAYLDDLAARGEKTIENRGSPSTNVMKREANRVASALQLGWFDHIAGKFKLRQGGAETEEVTDE